MTQTDTPRAGLLYAVAAYGLWGVLPVYFLLLRPSGAIEIVAFRILWSLVFCAILLAVTRSFGRFAALARDRTITGTLALAGAFIVVNWTTFIFATLTGHVVEAALGYFINPLVTVLLGVFVLREKLKPLQWVAVGVSVVAILVIAIGYGSFPWISLVLAFSFGFYGLIKKRVGGRVDAVSGLTIETLAVAIPAGIALVVVGATSGLAFGSSGTGHVVAVVGTGVITAVPLLLFASAARRLPLSTLGLTQYIAPILQLVVGVVVLHEPMTTSRWVGFALIWVALVILSIHAVSSGRRERVSGARRLPVTTSRIANETPR
ncbi:chloramphenicol-sensitive protein RarD [Frondihabitans sp. PhB188]|uniref:EamA family transporter RarD n=1 Tax=Frondihabitans sp. PhB188 TaxID=2485200 RepID=UPI000F46CCD6|nr:EamA family transporter RarD [Frondihabitans sp. PhB188]ROQ37448.1 chloramphenicol-sensitive protein RarD [Frondihabitans sp. PhB188]